LASIQIQQKSSIAAKYSNWQQNCFPTGDFPDLLDIIKIIMHQTLQLTWSV